MDLMVQKTQVWLNRMYGKDIRYNVVTETGLTGWSTIYALTRALQIELGITSTADNFGATSKSKFTAKYPSGVKQQVATDTTTSNVNAIIQGALWCKGYSTGASGITLNFYGGTGGAVTKLKTDAGLSTPDSTVTVEVMAALLSMNQYITTVIYGGTSLIRDIQQRLNRKYFNYIGLAPCDGVYGRDMNKALIYALQAVEGLDVATATGAFGATTQKLLPILPDTQNKLSAVTEQDALALLKYALCCNGYTPNLTTTAWDSNIESVISEFQKDNALKVTGEANVDTWMSLFLSKGNPDRAAIACDTRFEMTNVNLDLLKSLGYSIVGRYLTGTDFKVLRKDEPKRIIDKGFSFFPIFQESGTDISYFTMEKGIEDSLKAVKAARGFNIPEGTIIYFAVDLDAQNTDIRANILPYFSGISENIDKAYKVGVYGTRNVCQQVNSMGFATTSFVSDMSTGFSGNMGFKMPDNWNFDQFSEISVSSTLAIDKDGYSGLYPCVNHLTPNSYTKPAKQVAQNTIPILSIIDRIKSLEADYIAFAKSVNVYPTSLEVATGVLNFLRSGKYDLKKFNLASLFLVDTGYVDYIIKNDLATYNFILPIISSDDILLTDSVEGLVDLGHLAYTTMCYANFTPSPNFWTGWGGDLATGMGDTQTAITAHKNLNVQETADVLIGSTIAQATPLIGTTEVRFNYSDICTDADAIKLAKLIKESKSATNPLSESMLDYYTNYVAKRYSYYLDDIDVQPTLANLKTEIHRQMTNTLEVYLPKYSLLSLADGATDDVIVACCNSFANYIYSEI